MIDYDTLIEWYQDYITTTQDNRALQERDRDYYDLSQWTAEERAELSKRGQQASTTPLATEGIETAIGLEIESRADIKAFPRTPGDDESAEAATDSLRYIADNTDFDITKTNGAENLLIEGTMSCIIDVVETKRGFEIRPTHIPWDRHILDPHSVQKDGRDGKWEGLHVWMDLADAKAKYPDAEDGVWEIGNNTSDSGETFDDKPKNLYMDSTRSRVKLIEMYFNDDGWKHVVMTGMGEVVPIRPSPFLDEDGDPMNPIESQSAYIDRDNNRYGVLRRFISTIDDINKRSSKALHLLSARQVIAEEGVVEDVNRARRELAKPDGWVTTNPGRSLEIQQTGDLAVGQLNMLQEAKAILERLGGNAALGGTEERNLSGRALQIREKGGVRSGARVFDGLRHWEKRVYRQMWMRVKQFWTEEKWIRVTDDEENLKFVGLNRKITLRDVAEEQGIQFDPNDPRLEQVVSIENPVAELDVDIILERVPDTVNIEAEQFQLLANIFQANPDAVPFEMIIESSSLRNKERILERMKGGDDEEIAQKQAAAQEALQLEKDARIADIRGTDAKASRDEAEAEKTEVETLRAMVEPIGNSGAM